MANMTQLETITAAAKAPTRGDVFTYAGFRAVYIRHYYEGMVEVHLAGGGACVAFSELKPVEGGC
jgi:hypothetical protein